MSFHSVIMSLVCFLLFSITTGLSEVDQTLPVVNVKFENPVEDLELGGEKQKHFEDTVAFNKRAKHLVDMIDHDSEVIANFMEQAHADLNNINMLFQELSDFVQARSLAFTTKS